MNELLTSPLGVLLLARSIIEVSGTPPGMLWGENLGCYPAEDLASCLQALSLRVLGSGYFDRLSAERLSELLVQGEEDFTPWNDRYQWQADILLASGQALRPFVAPFLAAPGTATWFTDLDRHRQEWVSWWAFPRMSPSFILICVPMEQETPSRARRSGLPPA